MEVAARTCPTRLLTAQFQRRKGTKGTAFLRETFRKDVEHPDPAIAGNVMIGMTKLTNYLLQRQHGELRTRCSSPGPRLSIQHVSRVLVPRHCRSLQSRADERTREAPGSRRRKGLQRHV